MTDKSNKRKDILKAADVIFKKKGFHTTRMDEIAEKAGVGKGTLYEYFSSKQEIFEESCIENMRKILKEIEDISKLDLDFEQKMYKMFENEIKSQKCKVYRPEHILSQKNIMSEKVVKTLMTNVGYVYEIIMEIVEQGKDEGKVRKDISSVTIACAIIGSTSEYFKMKMFNMSDKENIGNYDEIFDLYYNGFGVK